MTKTLIGRTGDFRIYSDFGTSVKEGTLPGTTGGSGKTLTFWATQSPQKQHTVYLTIVPVTGSTTDFWDNFWSNTIGGEPADDFALSTFIPLDGSQSFRVNINADSAAEANATFEIRLFSGPTDPGFGVPPLASARFTITDDDAVIRGTGGNDTLTAKGTHTTLTGLAGHDVLKGAQGDDTLMGGNGNDTLQGGNGNDLLEGQNGHDNLNGGNGTDTLRGGAGRDTLAGGAGNDTLEGNAGDDFLLGGAGNDWMHGGSENDTLEGGMGTDTLEGAAGRDRLTGGAGADILTGGAGADTFVFLAAGDSSAGPKWRDTITDFSVRQGDRIDLSAIDADTTMRGNQAFRFVGQEDFTGQAGEITLSHRGGGTLVLADLDGDRAADFAIFLDGSLTLSADSFLL